MSIIHKFTKLLSIYITVSEVIVVIASSREVAVEKVEEEVTKRVESKTKPVSDDETFTTKPVPAQSNWRTNRKTVA